MDEDPDPQRINAGDRVIVWDLEVHEELAFNLMAGKESAVIENAVTLDSPVGKALLRHMTGDTVEVNYRMAGCATPSGGSSELRIMSRSAGEAV